jgi:hypothetical protein
MAKHRKCYLTTRDNPYDPFEQFDSWFAFDISHGYNSCGFLARIAKTSDQLSDRENEQEIEEAIDWILKNDLTLNYKKVVMEY